jgi:hypothetical protein
MPPVHPRPTPRPLTHSAVMFALQQRKLDVAQRTFLHVLVVDPDTGLAGPFAAIQREDVHIRRGKKAQIRRHVPTNDHKQPGPTRRKYQGKRLKMENTHAQATRAISATVLQWLCFVLCSLCCKQGSASRRQNTRGADRAIAIARLAFCASLVRLAALPDII